MAEYLRNHAAFLGEGKMTGKLFELGAYLGAVFLENSDEFVPGHVFKMHDPEQVLRVLDEYEGIGESFPQPNEYVREERSVICKDETLKCWVYLYNR